MQNRHIIWLTCFVLPIMALCVLSACDEEVAADPASEAIKEWHSIRDGNRTAQKDGIANVELIRDFHAIYPQAISFIRHYPRDDSVWESTVFLYGRYELILRVPVGLSENKRSIVSVGDPLFQLVEYVHIESIEGGRLSLTSGDSWFFGLSEWKQLKQAEGRIERVFTNRAASQPGHTLPADQLPFTGIHTDSPVPSFDDYVRYKKGVPIGAHN